MTTYENAVKASKMLDDMGVSAYEAEISRIIKMILDEKARRLRRRKGVPEKLTEDLPALFELAVEVYIGSAGASTPSDAAENTIGCYLAKGMDVDIVRKLVHSSAFTYLFIRS